jgi:hypothetical protein
MTEHPPRTESTRSTGQCTWHGTFLAAGSRFGDVALRGAPKWLVPAP